MFYLFYNGLLQVLHGCRQLVLWSVWLSPLNERNSYLILVVNTKLRARFACRGGLQDGACKAADVR